MKRLDETHLGTAMEIATPWNAPLLGRLFGSAALVGVVGGDEILAFYFNDLARWVEVRGNGRGKIPRAVNPLLTIFGKDELGPS
jgi:hypothetical protein